LVQLKEENMYIRKLKRRLSIASLLVFLCAPVAAQDVDLRSWTKTKEQWGQVLFCQRIYKLAEVKSRLYSFDIEHCDKAGQLIADKVTKYSEQAKMELKTQSEQHATLLSLNTSEPYHSVTACRAYCSELAEIQDKRND
jgi:hypothetical protein